MTDTDIRVFVCVGKRLNFSKAAEELYLSRQTVSKQIQKLEQQLGTKLFIRGGSGLAFTASGKQYFDFFERALVEFKDLQQTLSGEEKTIQLGYVPGCAAALNRIISMVQLCQDKEAFQVNLMCCDPSDMQAMLENGTLDIAVNFDLKAERNSGALQMLPFISSPRLLLVSRQHPKAATASSYRDFELETLLGWRRSNESIEEAAANLQNNSIQYGFHAGSYRIMPNLESANTALRMNMGVALGTQFNTIASSPDIVFFPLEFNVDLLLIWRKEEKKKNVLRFVQSIREQGLPIFI